MVKQKEKKVECKSHGNATKQNINGGPVYCLACNKEVK